MHPFCAVWRVCRQQKGRIIGKTESSPAGLQRSPARTGRTAKPAKRDPEPDRSIAGAERRSRRPVERHIYSLAGGPAHPGRAHHGRRAGRPGAGGQAGRIRRQPGPLQKPDGRDAAFGRRRQHYPFDAGPQPVRDADLCRDPAGAGRPQQRRPGAVERRGRSPGHRPCRGPSRC